MKSGQLEGSAIDGAAAAISSLCLLHCLLLPVAIAVLPAVGGGIAEGFSFDRVWLHWALIAVAAPVSCYALVQGVRLHHRLLPVALALAGFAVMALGAAAHGAGLIEPVLTVSGGLLVAFAHWRNWVARSA